MMMSMAKFLPASALLLLFFTGAVVGAAGEHYRFVQSQKAVREIRQEKLSHFRLYWHDIVGGPNATAVEVARAATTNTSRTAFGMVVMIDNALTEGPELTSKLVGRAQGLYASAAQGEVGMIMAMNFAFTEGKYNGSTIAILGRNTVLSEVREMPVVGGSGLFRLARGYAEARTHTFVQSTGDAIVEYNLFIVHY